MTKEEFIKSLLNFAEAFIDTWLDGENAEFIAYAHSYEKVELIYPDEFVEIIKPFLLEDVDWYFEQKEKKHGE